MEEYSKAFRDAMTSTLGWAGVILATFVSGFCAGYWIGHREITETEQTFHAFLMIPILWLGFPQMLLAYFVMAAAWYLPLRYDSRWLRIVAASANFLIWLVVVFFVVERTKDLKFFHY